MTDNFSPQGTNRENPCSDHLDYQILVFMSEGFPDKAIGNKLSLGHRTVQRRVQRIMARVGVSSRFTLGLRLREIDLFREAFPLGEQAETVGACRRR